MVSRILKIQGNHGINKKLMNKNNRLKMIID
jgi:hypothetical protein